MYRRSLPICVGLLTLALAACGDDAAKSNNISPNNTASDMAGSDTGTDDASQNGMTEDMGGGGDDTGGGGDDMGGDDMGGGDMGRGDMGPDPTLCGNAMLDPGEECDDANMVETDECKSDCTFTCGDGVVGAAEQCDTAIAAGTPGACPTACDDGVACTSDTLQGSECQARCVTGMITACADADGCCPAMCDPTNDDDCVAPPQCIANMTDGVCPMMCNANTDGDCVPMCGNGSTEMGEQCDDGNNVDGDGCDATCMSEGMAVSFRMSDLDLMDPHVFLQFFGCRDITNGNVPFNASPPINGLLQNAITLDDDGDGLLDLSFVAIMTPLDQSNGGTGSITVAEADCTAPMSGTTCTVDSAGGTFQTGTYTSDTMNDCLDVLMNTTRPYTPAIDASVPPCFASTTIDLTIDISGILVPLTDVQLGATYVGNPATGLATGLLRGFISEADADNITLPSSLPLIGGDPLSSVLPGGTGCCANHDDRDVGPDGSTMGWWFYLNFPADQVQVTIN